MRHQAAVRRGSTSGSGAPAGRRQRLPARHVQWPVGEADEAQARDGDEDRRRVGLVAEGGGVDHERRGGGGVEIGGPLRRGQGECGRRGRAAAQERNRGAGGAGRGGGGEERRRRRPAAGAGGQDRQRLGEEGRARPQPLRPAHQAESAGRIGAGQPVQDGGAVPADRRRHAAGAGERRGAAVLERRPGIADELLAERAVYGCGRRDGSGVGGGHGASGPWTTAPR